MKDNTKDKKFKLAYLTIVGVSKDVYGKVAKKFNAEPGYKYLVGAEVKESVKDYVIDIEFNKIPRVIEECVLLSNAFENQKDICHINFVLTECNQNGIVIDCMFKNKNLNEGILDMYVLEDMDRGVYTTFIPYSNINAIIF